MKALKLNLKVCTSGPSWSWINLSLWCTEEKWQNCTAVQTHYVVCMRSNPNPNLSSLLVTCHCTVTVTGSWIRFRGDHPPAEGGSFRSAQCLLGHNPQIQLVSETSRPPLEIKNIVRISITLMYKGAVILVSYLGQIFGAFLPWALQHLHLLQQSGRITKRSTIPFRVIFNQLTSSFVLLEKACQEFAHCLLWYK